MKKLIIILISIICVIAVLHLVFNAVFTVDLSMAQSAQLDYNDGNGTVISCEVDYADVEELKAILKGVKFSDSPSCSFGEDVSITFYMGDGHITVCPACDGCPLMQIGDSHYYIKLTSAERSRFNEIVKKYGMVFPCI